MSDIDEYTIKLDEVDAALLGSRIDIPGDTLEEKLVNMISADMRRLTVLFVGNQLEGFEEYSNSGEPGSV